MGTTANIDPVEGWKIVDGKLYLNYSREIQKKWDKDIPGNTVSVFSVLAILLLMITHG
jgi:hypothetical protein